MTFLRDMRSEFSSNLESINSKIDGITSSIDSLQIENEALRQENTQIKAKLYRLYSKVDSLEGHSRRNNLKFHGISGTANEPWVDTESKIREFMKSDLDQPNLQNVEIERAHRVKSKDSHTCPIIVKFSKYKDRDQKLKCAKQKLRETRFFVQEDFTDRVKICRFKLGKRLMEARKDGLYAALSFDKLIIENEIYKYDAENDRIQKIGTSRPKGRNKGYARDETDHNIAEQLLDDECIVGGANGTD